MSKRVFAVVLALSMMFTSVVLASDSAVTEAEQSAVGESIDQRMELLDYGYTLEEIELLGSEALILAASISSGLISAQEAIDLKPKLLEFAVSEREKPRGGGIVSPIPLVPVRGPAIPKPDDYQPYDGQTRFTMTSPPITVYLNGSEGDQSKLSWPLLFYDDIVYLPMSYDMGRYMNLSILWDELKGLEIEGVDSYEDNIESLHTFSMDNSFPVETLLFDFDVKINARFIDSLYPCVRYRDIIYLPMTWDITQFLQWDIAYQDNTLYIHSRESE